MSRAQHRIGRLVFDIRMSDRQAAARWEASLRARFDATVLPALQTVLDRIDRTDQRMHFDRVEVELGDLDTKRIDGELGVRLSERLTEALARQAPAPRGIADELIAFLRTGELPWTEPGKALASLCAQLLDADDGELRRLAQELAPTLIRHDAAERLLRQLPTALVRRLLYVLLPQSQTAIIPHEKQTAAAETRRPARSTTIGDEKQMTDLATAVCQLARGQQRTPAQLASLFAALDGRTAGLPPLPPTEKITDLATTVCQRARDQQRTPAQLASLFAALHGRTAGLPPLPPTAQATTTTLNPIVTQEVAPPAGLTCAAQTAGLQARPVCAAGAVLLHPFLGRFFEHLKLTSGSNRFHDHPAHARAVLLAHHLATGADDAPEPETLLFKLLCGFPLNAPLARSTARSAAEDAEVHDLLNAVIAHWGCLGKTSPAGLRESFLLRPGLLQPQGEHWQLKVESKGVDVLLQRLPWTLSHVRTPFMHATLRVEWR